MQAKLEEMGKRKKVEEKKKDNTDYDREVVSNICHSQHKLI